MADGSPESLKISDGVTHTDNLIGHVRDVGAGYFSLWNWHRILADRIQNYYDQYPDALNGLARSIGYRVRPSWVWTYEAGEDAGVVLGMVNDGIASVPGVLRISILDDAGRVLATGGLDAGYPVPHRVRQAKFPLPKGTDWRGLRVKGEIEVKGQRYPVRWACKQALESDGSLRLRATPGID
jgi:hypothetical protein